MILCYFFNPYIGLFSLFSIVTIFITFCMIINVKYRNKNTVNKQKEIIGNLNRKTDFIKNEESFFNKMETITIVSKRVISIFSYVWIVIFGLINIIVELVIWLLASGNLGIESKFVTPLILFSKANIYNISIVLLILGMIFGILTCILSFKRLLSLSKNF